MAVSGKYAEALAKNRLLTGLTPEILAPFLAVWDVLEVPVGRTIFEEDSEGDSLYLILFGAVAISKRGRGGRQERLVTFGPGDFFGEMAMIDRAPRSARAETTMDSVLVEVDETALRRLLAAGEGTVGFNLVRDAIRRLRDANEHFINELLREERLSTIGSMAGGIVHDFKNPISAIVGCCDLLMFRQPDPGVKEIVGIIQRATWAMVGMTQDLMDFTRGHISFRIETGDWTRLGSLLEEQVLQPLWQDGYQVETEIRVTGEVRMDFERMVRVLGNLLKNAREASAPKGKLMLRAWRKDDDLIMEVEDEGIGMAPELVAKLFQPFVTEGKPDGTGLGLAVSKSIVDGHGGHISVESKLGEGTTFRISLPQRSLDGVETGETFSRPLWSNGLENS
ncbi:MAG: hypothetical protein OHK005_02860 [Candidatus Methylacidiphilales bacterium]